MTFVPFVVNVDQTGIHYVVTSDTPLTDLPSHPAGSSHFLRLEISSEHIIYHLKAQTGTIQWGPDLLAPLATISDKAKRLLFISGLGCFIVWYHVLRDEIFHHYLPKDVTIGSNLLQLCRYPLISLRSIDTEKSAFYQQLLVFIEHYHNLFKPGDSYDSGKMVLNLQAQQYLMINNSIKEFSLAKQKFRDELTAFDSHLRDLRLIKDEITTLFSSDSSGSVPGLPPIPSQPLSDQNK